MTVSISNLFLKPMLVLALAVPLAGAVGTNNAEAGSKEKRAAIIAGAIIGGAIAYDYHKRKKRQKSYGHEYHQPVHDYRYNDYDEPIYDDYEDYYDGYDRYDNYGAYRKYDRYGNGYYKTKKVRKHKKKRVQRAYRQRSHRVCVDRYGNYLAGHGCGHGNTYAGQGDRIRHGNQGYYIQRPDGSTYELPTK